MHKPKENKYYQDHEVYGVLQQAQDEVVYEKWRRRVEEKKKELLTEKTLLDILFPWTITIERRKHYE